MLRITEQRAPGHIVLKLEGRCSGEWVAELDASWRALAAREHAPIWIDLTDVWGFDTAGQALLTQMYRAGVRFVTRGCLMREMVREISESR